MTGLKIAPGFELPLDAVTETFAILAKRRAGKSNAAVVMAEEMYDHGLPWVAIDPKGDWWGVRAAGDGKSPGLAVLVFGGMHGDVPLEPTSGRLVADLIIEQRLTCVLDVSEMTKADQRRFLIDFADRLYRRNTEPLHVFCEEADEYIPQRVMADNTKLVGAFETLIKRGGFRGIGVTLITQRSASLNKDVLTQIETLIPMRTPSPQDRKAILAWVDIHTTGAEAVAELPFLADGEAWVFSPQWLDTLVKIQFRRRRTFDSGSTPKVGGKPRPPATLAEVDLASIKEAMAETIEKANADDPKVLRKRITQLERELAKVPAPPAPERVEVAILTEDQVSRMEAVYDRLSLAYTEWAERLNEATGITDDVLEQINTIRAVVKQATGQHTKPAPRPAERLLPGPRPITSPPVRQAATPSAADDDVQLKAGARRILETIARQHPMRLTKAQLGTLAKFKITGGTFGTYWGQIRRAGFIDDNGTDFTLTDTGFDYIGIAPGNPMTTDEILESYRTVLKAGERKILDHIVDAYPAAVDRENLADVVEMTASGGTFQTYVGNLRRNGLIVIDTGQIRAADILFEGGAA